MLRADLCDLHTHYCVKVRALSFVSSCSIKYMNGGYACKYGFFYQSEEQKKLTVLIDIFIFIGKNFIQCHFL
jgi:hypothetical protein